MNNRDHLFGVGVERGMPPPTGGVLGDSPRKLLKFGGSKVCILGHFQCYFTCNQDQRARQLWQIFIQIS